MVLPRLILVPADGSPKALEGLAYAVTTYPEDRITVLSVMTPHGAWETDGSLSQAQFERWHEADRGEADDILDDARELASDHSTEITTEHDVTRHINQLMSLRVAHLAEASPSVDDYPTVDLACYRRTSPVTPLSPRCLLLVSL